MWTLVSAPGAHARSSEIVMGRVRSRTKTTWTPEERRVAMEQRLRAHTIPSRKGDGPTIDEWYDEGVEYGHEDIRR
jgi:hypothetical protein